MNKLNKFIVFSSLLLLFTSNSYGYRVKESPTTRFKIESFKEEIKKTNFNFDSFGKVNRVWNFGIL